MDWSGLPFPSPGDLPDPEIELGCPTLLADVLTSEPPGKNVVQWYMTDASKCCSRILLKLSVENFCIWVSDILEGRKGQGRESDLGKGDLISKPQVCLYCLLTTADNLSSLCFL